MSHRKGKLLAEGKTKQIWSVEGHPDLCIAQSKIDITAGDGAKHDRIAGKDVMANQTTCNVFRLLQRHDVPLAFLEQYDERSFVARFCQMLPWEVVARARAWGSYLKRYPDVEQGYLFRPPLVEFFLKTSGKQFKGHRLPEDDPYAVIDDDGLVALYNPKLPMNSQQAFLVIAQVAGWDRRNEMAQTTRRTFGILEAAWVSVGGRLIDFKIEFGLTKDGELVVADVVDNDSWRVLNELGEHIDKQAYRDGAPLGDVTAKYRYVAELTSQFVR